MKSKLIIALIAVGLTGMGTAVIAQDEAPDDVVIALNDRTPGPSNDNEFIQNELEEILTFGKIGVNQQPRMNRFSEPPHRFGDKNRHFSGRNDKTCERPDSPNDNECPRDGKKVNDNKMDGKCPMQMERHDGQRGPQQMERHDEERGRQRMGEKNTHTVILAYLMEKYPQEMADIAQLQQQAEGIRDLANTKLKELTKKAKDELKARQEKIENFGKMIQEYRKNKDPKILTQIEATVAEFYSENLTDMKKQIVAGEEKIKEMNARLATMSTNKDQEIAIRVKSITNDKK